MMQLSKTEEQLMEIIWKHEKVFMKDILEAYTDPKPASTTVSTLLKRIQEKGFIDFITYGNSRQYFPKVNKSEYFSKQINSVIKNFFNNSPLQFASFFTKATSLSPEELKELRNLIDGQIENKNR